MKHLVKLNSETTVAADQVAKIVVDTYGRGINVYLKGGGNSVWVDTDYGKTAYNTKDRLEREIVEALS